MEILPQPNNEYLVDGKYSITDLIDINRVQSIFDKFSLATGFTIGLLDHPGMRILAQAGWRDICTQFHRAKEDSAKICAVSNQRLMNNLNNPGKPTIEACDHGLIDCAVPILIKGVHIGSLATGQLLMHSVDPEQFKQQAKKYGFDEEAYMKALSAIPVISEQELNNVTLFMGEIASLISEMGYANLVIKEESEKMEQELAEHRRLERALSESEIRYETLFRGAVEGILAADIETKKFVFANPAICRMLGYKENELKKLGVNDIHPPDSIQMVSEAFEGLIKGNISSPVEVPCLKKDGSIIYADINSNQIMIKGRHILVGFFTDITARKRMNDELQTSLAKLRLTIDEAPICVITTNFDRRILSCNKAFCNMLGYTERELKEKTFTDITYPDDLHIGIDDIPTILEGKKKKSVIQKRYVRKDGGLVWVEIQINLVRDNQGEP
ncbi:MAG: PocR ligand-binding domain-containing protein, partial [Bacteroidota bacterium]